MLLSTFIARPIAIQLADVDRANGFYQDFMPGEQESLSRKERALSVLKELKEEEEGEDAEVHTINPIVLNSSETAELPPPRS